MGLDELITGNVVLDRYEIIGNLGRGGTAKVYRARDNLRDDEVALKVVDTDFERAKKEVAALHQLAKTRNDNVVQIYDADIYEDKLIISEEIVKGKTLFEFVQFYTKTKNEGFSDVLKLDLIYQISNGLFCVHECGLIHRDLNPWNVIIEYTPDLDESYIKLKIIDLGMSSNIEDLRNSLGSGFFASPEQYLGEAKEDLEIDFRSDIHTAGVLFYYIETRDFPFHDYFEPSQPPRYINADRVLCRIHTLRGNIKKNKLSYYKIIKKCLEVHPKNRYQSSAELLRDIMIEIKERMPKDDGNILKELRETFDSIKEATEIAKEIQEIIKDND